MFLAMLVALLPVQVAQACSAFIVGKDLTADGSTLFGRTEDYPYAPDGWSAQSKLCSCAS